MTGRERACTPGVITPVLPTASPGGRLATHQLTAWRSVGGARSGWTDTAARSSRMSVSGQEVSARLFVEHCTSRAQLCCREIMGRFFQQKY